MADCFNTGKSEVLYFEARTCTMTGRIDKEGPQSSCKLKMATQIENTFRKTYKILAFISQAPSPHLSLPCSNQFGQRVPIRNVI